MPKNHPGYTAYKITNTLANAFFALGVLGLIFATPFIVPAFSYLPFGPTSVISGIGALVIFVLVFIGLAILYSLYKLGEITENDRINLGIKIIGGGFALIFIGTPIGAIEYSSLTYTVLLIVLLLSGLAFTIGNFLLFMGLREYGVIEGSKTIADFSLILAILSIIEPALTLLFAPTIIGLEQFQIGIYMFLIGIILSFAWILTFVAFIALGLEFDKIAKRVDAASRREDIDEIRSEVSGKSASELKQFSKEKRVPFILLASLRFA